MANAVAVVGPDDGGSMSSRPSADTVHDTVTATWPPGPNADVSTHTWGDEHDDAVDEHRRPDLLRRGDRRRRTAFLRCGLRGRFGGTLHRGSAVDATAEEHDHQRQADRSRGQQCQTECISRTLGPGRITASIPRSGTADVTDRSVDVPRMMPGASAVTGHRHDAGG